MQLTADGLDAGPETIRWHLEQEGLRVLSTSTIRRILHLAGLVVPAAAQTPARLLHPLPSGAAQREVAVRLHALPRGGWLGCGDHQLAG